MKKGTSKKLTKRQAMDLDTLAAMADEDIDTSDIPEVRDWSGAERGLLFRPIKKQITLRVDAECIGMVQSRCAWRARVPNGDQPCAA